MHIVSGRRGAVLGKCEVCFGVLEEEKDGTEGTKK